MTEGAIPIMATLARPSVGQRFVIAVTEAGISPEFRTAVRDHATQAAADPSSNLAAGTRDRPPTVKFTGTHQAESKTQPGRWSATLWRGRPFA